MHININCFLCCNCTHFGQCVLIVCIFPLSLGTKKMEYKTRQWHEKCFSCVVCKSSIGTKSFIPRDQEVYCATCYEEKFSTRCVKCDKVTVPRTLFSLILFTSLSKDDLDKTRLLCLNYGNGCCTVMTTKHFYKTFKSK